MVPDVSLIFMRALVVIICACVWVAMPQSASCQTATPDHGECATTEKLKTVKTASPVYTEESGKNNIEGTVALCVTVGVDGKVTNVRPLKGPPELMQASVDAVKQWEFEPPKAPASVKFEFGRTLTKGCPETPEKKTDQNQSDRGDIVTTIVPTDEKAGDVEIVSKLNQPWPPYPEAVRAQRIRGQLYLSVVVNSDGNVSDVRIVKSLDERLDQSALGTVRTWKFKVSPGRRARFFVTLSFRLPCLDD